MNTQTLREMRIGYLTVIFGVVSAVFAFTLQSQSPAAQIFLGIAFAGAAFTVIASELATGTVTELDSFALLVTGFAATAIGAPSVSEEAFYAALRIAFLGGAVGSIAWLYFRTRGISGVGFNDIKIVAAIGAALPLALAIYTIAFGLCLIITVNAVKLLRSGNQAAMAQLPIASVSAGLAPLVWAAYNLQSFIR